MLRSWARSLAPHVVALEWLLDFLLDLDLDLDLGRYETSSSLAVSYESSCAVPKGSRLSCLDRALETSRSMNAIFGVLAASYWDAEESERLKVRKMAGRCPFRDGVACPSRNCSCAGMEYCVMPDSGGVSCE